MGLTRAPVSASYPRNYPGWRNPSAFAGPDFALYLRFAKRALA
jgi:hypothetical protein